MKYYRLSPFNYGKFFTYPNVSIARQYGSYINGEINNKEQWQGPTPIPLVVERERDWEDLGISDEAWKQGLRDTMQWDNSSHGTFRRIVVSKRMKDIMEQFDLCDYFSYDLNVEYLGKQYPYYLIVFNIIPNNYKYIDFKKTSFYVVDQYGKNKKIHEKNIFFKDVASAMETIQKHSRNMRYCHPEGNIYITEKLDFLNLFNNFCISERLLQAFQKAELLISVHELTQFDYIPFNHVVAPEEDEAI